MLNRIRNDSNRRKRKTNIQKITREKPVEMIRPFIENKSGENPMVSLHLQMNGNHRHTLVACIHNTPYLNGKYRVHYHHRCSTTRFRCLTLMNHYLLHNPKYQIQTILRKDCPHSTYHTSGGNCRVYRLPGCLFSWSKHSIPLRYKTDQDK